MNFKKIISILLVTLIIIISFCGCSADSSASSEINFDELFTSRDLENGYDEDEAKYISLSDETITINKEGVYVLSGAISDGQIIINADESAKIQLVLNGVTINSSSSAAIYIIEADKVFITTAKETDNTLTTTGKFLSDGDINVDGVIFSKADLTLNGQGTLNISTSYGNGIVSKDDLKLTSGAYNINVSKNGLEANDIIAIADGEYNIEAQNDALNSDEDTAIIGGTLNIIAEDDGIHTSNELYVKGGKINISQSYEGLEGKAIYISGGDIKLNASDDGLNAAGGNDSSGNEHTQFKDEFSAQEGVIIEITGGNLYVNCEGDGIDSNGDLTISSGNIIVEGPQSSGNGALDYNGEAEISGGTILAIGSSGMAMNFTEASQGSILVNFSSSYSNETITITDSSSNVIYSFDSTKTINSILFSSPDLKKGETYTITIGDQYQTVTLTDYIYGSSSGMGMGMMR